MDDVKRSERLGLHSLLTYIHTMKKIKEMVNTAPTKSMAIEMLNIYRNFGDITEDQYKKGRELIRKEFTK